MRDFLPSGVVMVCLLGSQVLFGCAVGNQFRYHDIPLEISATGSQTIVVGVHDQRNYVVDGEKDPSYVGTIRGGYGNPFNAWTDTENPLSTDLSATLVKALKEKGFKATAVELTPTMPSAEALEALKKGDAQRILLLTLKEWRTDTYIKTSLYLDVVLTVLTGKGKELAIVMSAGEDDLGGNAWNPPAHAKAETPKAAKKRIELLLNHPDVIQALQP